MIMLFAPTLMEVTLVLAMMGILEKVIIVKVCKFSFSCCNNILVVRFSVVLIAIMLIFFI